MTQTSSIDTISQKQLLPSWFRQDIPEMSKIRRMKAMFRKGHLHTVCESALCPNMGTCWSRGVATFMILGETCTRACRFCAIEAGRAREVDKNEPFEVARSVKSLGLRYVVVTSVARDDLPDEGAGQFAQTIGEIRVLNPQTKIEVLIPDFSAHKENLKIVLEAGPEVVSHNIETVRRLSPKVRPQADYDRSLKVLRMIKEAAPGIISKTSLMAGLGETHEEIFQTMKDLRNVDCQILTLGQYLAPTKLRRHLPVERFYSPEEFDELNRAGRRLGFEHVMSGPLVRSSYIAEEGFYEVKRRKEQRDTKG